MSGAEAGSASAGSSSAVRTVFFGSGSFAVPILEALASMPGVSVAGIVSAPDRPVGRKAVLTPTPVSARASELGLTLLQPTRVRKPEGVAAVRALAPQLAILADYGQLIPRELLELPPRGFLNLHPSALPRHRGASPIAATILAGDRASAVSLMVLSEEMDAGPIVAVGPVEVRPDDTAVTLEARAAEVAADLLARVLPEWLAGRLAARPQPAEGVTTTRPLRREDGLLDAAGLTAVELERQVRAYQPWPGAHVETPLGRIIVWRAHVEACNPGTEPGQLVSSGREGLALLTREESLVLDEVQPAGGRRMSAAELLRGRPGLVVR